MAKTKYTKYTKRSKYTRRTGQKTNLYRRVMGLGRQVRRLNQLGWYDDTTFETPQLMQSTWTSFNTYANFFTSYDASMNNATLQARRIYVTAVQLNLQIARNAAATSPRDLYRVVISTPKDRAYWTANYANLLPNPVTRPLMPSDYKHIYLDKLDSVGDTQLTTTGNTMYQAYSGTNCWIRKKLKVNKWLPLIETDTAGVANVAGLFDDINISYISTSNNEYALTGSIRIYYVLP